MVEKLHEPLASIYKFSIRLLKTITIGLIFILIALLIGMTGYHFFEDLSWIDAFTNASMILSGMGQIHPLKTTGGKIFAGSYALFSGLVFIIILGLMLGPIVHRFLHIIHTKNKTHEKGSKH